MHSIQFLRRNQLHSINLYACQMTTGSLCSLQVRPMFYGFLTTTKQNSKKSSILVQEEKPVVSRKSASFENGGRDQRETDCQKICLSPKQFENHSS